MSNPKLLRSFHFRVALAIVASMVFVFAMGNYLIFKYALDSQFEAIRTRLMVIAQTSALLVDAQEFEKVPLTKDGVTSESYQKIAANLNKIRLVNPQIKYIYTMKKTATDGQWQFVVDPQPVAKVAGRRVTSYPGDAYNAARYPEMMKAFDGASADRALTVDEWGSILSGYAPIKNESGEAIGMLGVDVISDDIKQMREEVYRRGWMVLGVGIILSLLIGMLLSQRVTSPLLKLTDATRHLAQGKLSHRVRVGGSDEIGELAVAFNVMAQNLEESRGRLMDYFYDVVKSLIKILELRDQYTRGHSEAVAEHAGNIARKMGYPEETIKLLEKMTLLHDIGKIGVRDTILNKNGTLNEDEWKIIKNHPLMGEEILKPVLRDEEMLSVVRSHHERYDGTGYPDGLSKDQISIFASIVTVADAYDAMVSVRAYKSALTPDQAVEELKRHSGSQFHPEVVKIFIQILQEEGVV